MSDKKMVQIPLSKLQYLMRRDLSLSRLEACGVDNWSGYGSYNYESLTGSDVEKENLESDKEAERYCIVQDNPESNMGEGENSVGNS